MSRIACSTSIKSRRFVTPPSDQQAELDLIRAAVLGLAPITAEVDALCRKHYNRYIAERRAGRRSIGLYI